MRLERCSWERQSPDWRFRPVVWNRSGAIGQFPTSSVLLPEFIRVLMRIVTSYPDQTEVCLRTIKSDAQGYNIARAVLKKLPGVISKDI